MQDHGHYQRWDDLDQIQGCLRFQQYLRKNHLKSFCDLVVSHKNFPMSAKVIFSLLTNLFESIGFTASKFFLLSVTFFSWMFIEQFFFVFLTSDTQRFCCFAYIFLSSSLPVLRNLCLSLNLLSDFTKGVLFPLIYLCFLGAKLS